MSLPQTIKDLDARLDHVVFTQPAFYAAAAFDIFTITGGPVWIKVMVEYLFTAMTNVTETTIDVCGIDADAGTVAINAGAIGSIVVSPLSNNAKNASALADQWPDATGAGANAGFGMIAGLGEINITFATVMDAADRYTLHIVYQKLSAASLITPNF